MKICAPDERCTETVPDGTFRLADVRAGLYSLRISAPGLPAFQSEEVEVRAGLESKIEITLPSLEAVRQAITVSATEFVAPEEVKTSGFLIQQREIFKAAGVQQDVSRYVQVLPGVAIGTNDFRNDLIVRGGSPLENLFVVDNVEIPNPRFPF
jgi:hypothetical protein